MQGTIICLNEIKIRVGVYTESSQFIPEEKEGQQMSWHLQTNMFPQQLANSTPSIWEQSHTDIGTDIRELN